MSETITRPVLRYHGGKWNLAPWIIAHFPEHRVYVEPFGGGASVLLRKRRAPDEFYNDLDGEVVNFFSVLRDPAQRVALVEMVRCTPYARAEYQLSLQPTDDPVERARRTVMRSFMGFKSASTTLRTLDSGFRPIESTGRQSAAPQWVALPGVIERAGERFQGVVIESMPAVEMLRKYDHPEALHYVDPPYPLGTRYGEALGECYAHEMSDADHRALAEVLHALQGAVVLSGYPCDLYDHELFPTWRRVTRRALADGARERTEVLWLNAAAARALPQRSLFDA